MSFPSLPHSSASSKAFWSLKADPPEEGQPRSPTAIYSTGAKNAWGRNFTDEFVVPPPEHTALLPRSGQAIHVPVVNGNHEWDETGCCSISAFVRDSNSYPRPIGPYSYENGWVDPYRADGVDIPPPERTAIRLMEHSFDPHGGDCNGWCNETDGRGATFSAFVRDANSYGRFVGPSSHKKAPGHTDFAQRDQTNNGSSTNTVGIKGELRTVWQLGFSDVQTIPETTTIYEARCLLKHYLDVLVVTDSNGLPSGTFEEKDLRKEGNAPEMDIVKNMAVSKVMTKSSMFVSPDTLGVDAVKLMIEGL